MNIHELTSSISPNTSRIVMVKNYEKNYEFTSDLSHLSVELNY